MGMGNTVLFALWLLGVGAALLAYVARRRKRTTSASPAPDEKAQ
jgi:hypothetical protein